MSKMAILLFGLLALAACDQNVGPPGVTAKQSGPAVQGPAPQAAPAQQPAATGNEAAAGVTWTAPSAWVSEGARPMRAATYQVPAAARDSESGECAVFYFGPGQGGDADANVKRWIGQFTQPDGKDSAQVAKTGKQTINGLNVTTIDLTGTYALSAGPMSPVKENKPGYRLMGAIVEAPQGNLFFKFTGPAATVAAHSAEFQAMLNSIRKP